MPTYLFRAFDTAGVKNVGTISVPKADTGEQRIKAQGMFLATFEELFGDIFRVRGRFPDGKAGVRYFEAGSIESLLRSLRTAEITEISRILYVCGRRLISVKTVGLRGMMKKNKAKRKVRVPGWLRITGDRVSYRYAGGILKSYRSNTVREILRVPKTELPLHDVWPGSPSLVEQLYVKTTGRKWIAA